MELDLRRRQPSAHGKAAQQSSDAQSQTGLRLWADNQADSLFSQVDVAIATDVKFLRLQRNGSVTADDAVFDPDAEYAASVFGIPALADRPLLGRWAEAI